MKRKTGKQQNSIGTLNEGSLHSQLKDFYALPGDLKEHSIDGYVIDIVRGKQLIEIQTGHFSKIKKKLGILLTKHKVRLIYPVPLVKWIISIDPVTSYPVSKRKSPKKGSPLELFSELIRIPAFINKRKFQIEILMIEIEETRCKDGKGSWRRRGISIKERRLIHVHNTLLLKTKKDFLQFLPPGLPSPFTNKILATHLGCTTRQSTRMTYCLKKMGLISESGKMGRSIAYTRGK